MNQLLSLSSSPNHHAGIRSHCVIIRQSTDWHLSHLSGILYNSRYKLTGLLWANREFCCIRILNAGSAGIPPRVLASGPKPCRDKNHEGIEQNSVLFYKCFTACDPEQTRDGTGMAGRTYLLYLILYLISCSSFFSSIFF